MNPLPGTILAILLLLAPARSAAGPQREPPAPALPDLGYDPEVEAIKRSGESDRGTIELVLGLAFLGGIVVYGFLRWQAQEGRRRRS